MTRDLETMCGIFAAVSDKPVAHILLEGLKRLEYRGYDSAGIAMLDDHKLKRVCAVGKVTELESRMDSEAFPGCIGIAHTRWATHGSPSEANSHPHMADGVAVVHNGIVENHGELRRRLKRQGCSFLSETDSEVIPWLISRAVAGGAGAANAVRSLSDDLEGSYAVAVLTEADGDVLHAKRHGSPLVAALGPLGGYLSSDISALAGFADEAIVLDDGDQVELRRDAIAVFDKSGRAVTRPRMTVEAVGNDFDKGGYPHYMLKEIHDQPGVARAIESRYDAGDFIAEQVTLDFNRIDRIRMIACGTSYYACQVARRWFAEVAGLSADVELASEHRYEPVVADGLREAAILVSQSGETADTLASLDKLKGLRVPTVGIVNQQGSTLAREADFFLPLLAGKEIGVASTKAFLAQLLVLARLVAHAADQRGHRAAAKRLRTALVAAPKAIEAALHNESAIVAVAESLAKAQSALFVGRGALYPLAMEGALKLKEISYIHAEGFAAGELKHGPIALVDDKTPIVALAPSGDLFPKLASNLREIAARNGRIILLGDRKALLALSDIASASLTLPSCDELIQPIVAAVPLQFLAYYVAVARGLDIDRPRNLAKSVTVE
ncbi:glutamine--fructose-6-phosphate transaminase (isomerizing) [Roseiarcus fermentans]|nr:glutamine--fructose-6-phosphate transaminase (isomerizing) [Roseiarcus fermentans]